MILRPSFHPSRPNNHRSRRFIFRQLTLLPVLLVLGVAAALSAGLAGAKSGESATTGVESRLSINRSVQPLVVSGTTYTVNSLNDPGTGTCDAAECTLREALAAATSGADTINITATGTIYLTKELPIAVGVTINGPGASQLNVSANNPSSPAPSYPVRVFHLTVANPGVVTFSGLKISNGYSDVGAGIYNGSSGTVSIINSTVAGNRTLVGGGGGIINISTGTINVINSDISGNDGHSFGGGIDNESTGTINISDSALYGNSTYELGGGGGIGNYHGGTVNITNSTLSNNDAGGGGGIYNSAGGTLTVTNSTLVGNHAHSGGGGIVNDGIANFINSTFSNNSSGEFNAQPMGRGGGILNGSGTVNITDCTLVGNRADNSGGGIYTYSSNTVRVRNSIIALNTAPIGFDLGSFVSIDYPPSLIISLGHNLIGKLDYVYSFTGANSDLIGTAKAPLDPLLGTLANNGGPTQTCALLPGSPAIDKGSSVAGITTDQRGRTRPFDNAFVTNATDGDGSDIGAFELTTRTVTKTADTNDGVCDAADCSLREATATAAANDAIDFASPLFDTHQTITLADAVGFRMLVIDKTLSIYGPGANLLTVQRSTADGTSEYRVFQVTADSNALVTFAGLTIANGKITTGDGGGIQNQSTASLSITNCTISGNLGLNGGGIFNKGGPVTIANSTLSQNSARGGGGGIYSTDYGYTQVINSILSGNSAGGNGGGIAVVSGGGAPRDPSSIIDVTNSTLSNNSAGASGGGIYNTSNGVMHVGYSTLSGNSATRGGGIANSETDENLYSSSIINSTLSNNSAPGGSGGGIFYSGSGHIIITNSTLSNNSAPGGSGGGFAGGAPGYNAVGFRNTIIALNTAPIGPDLLNAILSNGHNLIGQNDGSTGFTPGANHDLVGTSAAPLDPRLGSLVNNGGPTMTQALLPGSPAIDAGDNCVIVSNNVGYPCFLALHLYTDQRGFTRGVNGTVDIGAFESRGFTIAASGGTPQNTSILSPFGSPLVATVSSAFGEPVAGGVVTFAAPSSGASATFPGLVPTFNASINASGQASASPTANAIIGGPYNVIASGNGIASSASFSLTNTKVVTNTTLSSSSNPSELNQSVTFTATVSSGAGTPTGTAQFKIDGANSDAPVVLNASGVATLTTAALTAGTHTVTADYSGDQAFVISTGTLSGGQVVNNRPLISLSQSNYSVDESTGFVTVTVNRTGDLSVPVSVDYATDDTGSPSGCGTLNSGMASARCDFGFTLGTLKFAANETQQTFVIPITQDSYSEAPEMFTVNLSTLTGTGAAFATPSSATVTINDSAALPSNASDDTDAFVRQQYRDFLNREADPAGLAFWKDNIDKCNDPARRPAGLTPAQCIEVMRTDTSAAFFLSIEFQSTGNFVRSFYVAALDRPLTDNMPAFVEFERDTQAVQRGVVVGQGNWQQTLNDNRDAFMKDFVLRAEFIGLYPTTDSPTQYVDKLYLHAGVSPSSSERGNAIAEFGSATTAADAGARGRALLDVTQNTTFQQREFNRSFVHMEYFGYLRRNPNDVPDGNYSGCYFWLNKLNAAGGNFISAEMVKAFIISSEYRRRFGP